MASRTTAHDAYHEKSAELTATPDQIYDLENPENEDVEMDEKEKKRILRKLDLRIVPYVTLLYLVSFLDRVYAILTRVASKSSKQGLQEHRTSQSCRSATRSGPDQRAVSNRFNHLFR